MTLILFLNNDFDYDEKVQHGLIAAIADQSLVINWATAAYQEIAVTGDATSWTDGSGEIHLRLSHSTAL
jgi:hypothetical protein